ncbi:DMT family transporter [archaeon]|nr:MAG: DMT family transporter [archaeon]
MYSVRMMLMGGLVFVSAASILIRLSSADPLVIAAYRMGIASAIMVTATTLRNEWPPLRSLARRDAALMIVAGIALGIHFATWISSLFYTSVAVSVIVVNSSPLIVLVLSMVLLKEGISRKGSVGLMCALLGGAVIVLNEAIVRLSIQGVTLAFCGALGVALYLVIGRHVRRSVGTLPYVSIVYLISFLFIVALPLALGYPMTGYPLADYVIFFLLAAGPSCLGHTAYNYALKYLPAPTVSATIVAEPIGASFLAWIVLGEVPTMLVIGGGALVLIGIGLVLDVL